MSIGNTRMLQLFGHYDAFEETQGAFTYVDVKAIPMGLFGNVLLRIIREYRFSGLEYVDHFELEKNGSDFRIILLFKEG